MNNNVTPFLLLAVAIGLFYTYINPPYAELGELKAQQSRYAEALVQVNEIQSIKDGLLAKYNSFSREDLAKLERLLPDKVDDVRLVLDIDNIASRYGISVKNIRITRPTVDLVQYDQTAQVVGHETMTIGFTFNARYEDFIGFIKELEESMQLIDAANVNILPTDNSNVFTYNVTIHTYWLK